ncbi:SDR family oxidoreductase [Chitinimonas koreensis]|uniref:SDR family oxidoreductase n=1 Tax=Chitinimonas koreensis TaxID=356302 RepID=UPI0004223588|nr:SDR family oxidoreductase [Chitinimonas koreensis]QNM98002.1 SDR family oxidoreductase [Chitinimonas koreensis]
MDYKNKVVWITGASSGIGEALAYALAERGATLVLSARRQAELERVRAACARPEAHWSLPLDLAEIDTLAARAAEVEARFGRVDLLINNAGLSQRSLARDTVLAVDRRLIEVDYLGTVALTKAVLPGMLARRSGHLVAVTSLVGKFGTPMRSSYAAAKHALHGFFDSLRAELWRDGIRVSLVCPGFIKTNLSYVALTADGSPQGKMDYAQQHGIEPAECARRILAGLERGRDEIYVAQPRELLAVYLKRFAPGLFARILRKARVV